MLTFGSVCSGIDAASAAWGPLGWRAAWFAEIEPSPSAVLAHHYPSVPNLGDMTKIAGYVRQRLLPAPDILVGGTPCQAFSVAGLRAGLNDPRGQLTLSFADLANAIDEQRPGDECLIYWENVPGVLSDKTNAFGCFLALLAGEDDALVAPGGKWSNAGCIFGPQRTIAWRITDAQYFGVAQRRRRLFLVASARDGFDPAKLLFEFDGVRRDTAPSRKTGQDVAGTISTRAAGGGGLGTDFECAGGLQAVSATLDASYGRLQGCSGQDANHGHSHLVPVAFGGNNQSGSIDVATACRAYASPHLDFESETFLVQPIGFNAQQGPDSWLERTGPLAVNSTQAQAVCFSSKDFGADATVDLAPTMRAMNHAGSHANGGGQLAVCVTGEITHTLLAEGFDASEDGAGRGQPIVTAFKSGQSEAAGGIFLTKEFAPTLQAQNNGSTAVPAVQYGMAVRRLTPRECERLQGFPDDYTLVPVYKGKNRRKTWAKDGPRYKALGNSMCVLNMRWLGRRLILTHPEIAIRFPLTPASL